MGRSWLTVVADGLSGRNVMASNGCVQRRHELAVFAGLYWVEVGKVGR